MSHNFIGFLIEFLSIICSVGILWYRMHHGDGDIGNPPIWLWVMILVGLLFMFGG